MKILTCTLLALIGTCANAATAAQVTVTVKTIGGMTESGDGYTFKTKAGKEYYVYNAGGESPIPGEKFIILSADKSLPICLKLATEDDMGDIASVTRGACKK
jgi:hypothetical protein